MKKNSPSAGRNGSSKVSMTLGRDRFAKISAVEGITLATDMRKRVAEFDRRGASAEERRRLIIRAHSKG